MSASQTADQIKDAELFKKHVKLALKGDESSKSFLIRTTQERLTRFTLMLTGNRPQAEDLCQETYLKALTHLGQLRDAGRFREWLFQTAKNLFLDSKKGLKASAHLSIDTLENDLKHSTETSEQILQIRETLSHLKEDDRLILLLVDLEQYSYAEAAKIVGITEANLRFKLHHARKSFLTQFRK